MFVNQDKMIGELAPEGADESLDVAVLSRRARRDEELADAEILDAAVEDGAEDLVSIADEELESAVLTAGLHDLLGGPLRQGWLVTLM
jgi:hypothetical protein